MISKRWAALGLPAIAASMVMVGSPAMASDSGRDGVEASGNCSAGADWTLKAKPDDGRIEVEFEVDSNVSGQTWTVKITDNGAKVFQGQRVTQGASGSFSVERKTTNLAGPDKFVGRATNPATGETCRGTVTL